MWNPTKIGVVRTVFNSSCESYSPWHGTKEERRSVKKRRLDHCWWSIPQWWSLFHRIYLLYMIIYSQYCHHCIHAYMCVCLCVCWSCPYSLCHFLKMNFTSIDGILVSYIQSVYDNTLHILHCCWYYWSILYNAELQEPLLGGKCQGCNCMQGAASWSALSSFKSGGKPVENLWMFMDFLGKPFGKAMDFPGTWLYNV